jgi:hypothetical protein
VAILHLHAASFSWPRNGRSILLSEESVCAPEHQGSAELPRTPLSRSSKNDPLWEVQRTRKKSQDLKPRLFHGCSLDWPGLSRKRYRTLQEEMPDSPGRNAGLSRKKCRTLQEKIPDSPGRNAGLSRKYVLEFFLQTRGFCERRSCAPVCVLLYCCLLTTEV